MADSNASANTPDTLTPPAKPASPIKQLFFDCDNTLVMSEDTAFRCTADLVNKLLAAHGIEGQYTTEQLATCYFGLTFRAMTKSLQEQYGFGLSPDEISYWVKKEEDAIIEELHRSPKVCANTAPILKKLHSDGNYGLAVVSSSQIHRVIAALEACDLMQHFKTDHIFSAKSSMPTPDSKPNHAIYEWAMAKLGVKPEECVAVEDSRSGVQSAVDAGIACIAYVGAYSSKDQREQVGQLLLDSGCKVVMHDWSEFFECLKMVERAARR